MHTKTLTVVLGICAGVVVGKVLVYGTEIAIASFTLSILQFAVYWYERKNVESVYEKNDNATILHGHFSLPLLSGIFFVCIFFGVMRMQFIEEKNNFICEEVCQVIATITTPPKVQDGNQSFSVTPDVKVDTYDIRITTPLYPKYKKGEVVTLVGKVKKVAPTMLHSNHKYFDYQQYLHIQNIGSEMVYPSITVSQDTIKNNHSILYIESFREGSVNAISSYVDEPSASLASGMLFGATSMSKELVSTFRVAGLSHIVVVSGFNIAILVGAVLLLCMFMPLLLRVLLATCIIIIFVIMVGGGASIIRASLMACIGLSALLVGRAYTARQALLLSLLFIILYQPENLLYDASLHLSFLATAGIIYMSDGIKNKLSMVTSITYREIITTTLAAYIATLPYIMYAFGTVSVYALLTNAIVLPFVPLMMLLTFLVVVFSKISNTLAVLFGYVDTLLGGFVIGIAELVERLPFASFSLELSLHSMIVIYCVIGVLYYFFMCVRRNETPLTKSDFPLSEIISY